MKIAMVVLATSSLITFLFTQVIFWVTVADSTHGEATEWYVLGWWYFLPMATALSVSAAVYNGTGDLGLIIIDAIGSVSYLAVLVLNIVYGAFYGFDRFVDCTNDKSATANEALWCKKRYYVQIIQFILFWLLIVLGVVGIVIHAIDFLRALRNFMNTGDDDSDLKGSSGSADISGRRRKYAGGSGKVQ